MTRWIKNCRFLGVIVPHRFRASGCAEGKVIPARRVSGDRARACSQSRRHRLDICGHRSCGLRQCRASYERASGADGEDFS